MIRKIRKVHLMNNIRKEIGTLGKCVRKIRKKNMSLGKFTANIRKVRGETSLGKLGKFWPN